MKLAVAPGVGTTSVESVVTVKPADDLRELIGKRIGNYVIERTLARGGLSIVFVAKHPALRREVAIKFLRPSLDGDMEMAERFLQEAKVTATLSHPNVVEVLDFGESERRPYYMMELLQGQDLRAKLSARRSWPYREVVAYVEQVCEALETAHKLGVVHRELKPENIFVLDQEPLKLKVMGFGVANATGVGSTLRGQPGGTPTYLAPEQALGQDERISPQTDLYALGVIAFEMLTGKPPFTADSPLTLLSMHIGEAAPPICEFVPDVPKRVAELIESCLAKDPARRPRSARVLATQLVTACRMLERTRAAQLPKSADEETIVEELAQRLVSPGQTPADVDGLGVEVPLQVNVRLSDDTASSNDVSNLGDFDASFGFSHVPPPRGVASSRGEEARVESRLDALTRDDGPVLASNSGAGTGETREVASSDVVGAEALAAPNGADVATSSLRGEALRTESTAGDSPRGEYLPGAAVLGVPGQSLVSEATIEARLRALQRAAAQQREGVVSRDATEAADAGSGLDAALESEPPLLSEITDDVAPVNTKFTREDGVILERLLRRMQRRGDFPSFLSNMTEIVAKSNSEGQYSAGQLADALRKDYGLTARLLKVVNTAFMSRFKGRVYSVHQAIVILGFDSVRSIASSVSVYKVPGVTEGQAKHKVVGGKYNTRLAESAINSLVSGEIARLLSAGSKLRLDPEIAMMAATFRNLGQHLVMQYLPEEFEKIEDLMEREKLSLPVASERVLGIALRKLGVGIMQRWQLPVILRDAVSSQVAPGQALERDTDRLGALARFSTDLCDIVLHSGQTSGQRAVQRLLDRNRALLVLDEAQVANVIATISKSFEDRFAALLGPYSTRSRFIANAREIVKEMNPAALDPEPPVAIPPTPEHLEAVVKHLEEDLRKRVEPDKLAHRALTTIAETLNVPRVLLLVPSFDKRQLEMRAGVGREAEALQQVLTIPITQPGNVFAAALGTNKPVLVDDALSSSAVKRVPQPYYEILGSPCFVLLSCTGVGYAGAVLLADVNAPEHLPEEAAMTATRGLRNVLAQIAHRFT